MEFLLSRVLHAISPKKRLCECVCVCVLGQSPLLPVGRGRTQWVEFFPLRISSKTVGTVKYLD